jgi:hypothetical protein
MKTQKEIINKAYNLGFKAGTVLALAISILIGGFLAICLINFLG